MHRGENCLNIYLIRHGEKAEYAGDVAKIKLTEKGVRQADLLGKRLTNARIKLIFSSDMTRAIQTAEEINKYLNVRIEIRSNLKEIDMGECDTQGWDYVFNTYPDFKMQLDKHEVDIKYPNGECGEDVWNRAKKVLFEVVDLGLDNVAIVTHGGTIRSLICGVLNVPQAKRFYFGYPPEHCSISILKYNNNRFFLHTFNDYLHLGEDV